MLIFISVLGMSSLSNKWSTIENNELIISQKSWLTIRDQCGSDKECIAALYKIRMMQEPFLKKDEVLILCR